MCVNSIDERLGDNLWNVQMLNKIFFAHVQFQSYLPDTNLLFKLYNYCVIGHWFPF